MVEADLVSREYKRIGNDNTRNPWHIYYKASGVCEGLICEGGTGLGPGLLVESFVGGSFLVLGLLTLGLVFKSRWDEAQVIRRGQQLVDEGEARLAAGVLAQASGKAAPRTILRRQPSGRGGGAAVCLSTAPVPTIRRTNSGAILDLSQLSPTVLRDFTLQQHSAGVAVGVAVGGREWSERRGLPASSPSEAQVGLDGDRDHRAQDAVVVRHALSDSTAPKTSPVTAPHRRPRSPPSPRRFARPPSAGARRGH
mmetsp:Transcript_10165/g.32143  ORF Transcript_10165/g.32143 Transcript_10165/m.32143 type:complete len:253 (-) Transcript_10165:392-1150(-)